MLMKSSKFYSTCTDTGAYYSVIF